MELVRAPWVRPGVVVHDLSTCVDELLADFALALSSRGFRVAGFVQLETRRLGRLGEGCADRIELFDLSDGRTLSIERDAGVADGPSAALAADSLRTAMRDHADLVVISRFAAFEKAARQIQATMEEGIAHGMPVLTSIAGHCLDKWYRFAGHDGAMLAPDPAAMWQWWGSERLYRDLALGVAEAPVRRMICGPRYLMVESDTGVGLAPLPKGPAPLLPRLQSLQQMTLRSLAEFTQSWDGLEMAVGIAAINAHYNHFDLDVAFGNGAQVLRDISGRVMVIGAFPGLAQILPSAQVIEARPRPGELPTIAMDTVLPGCAATVVSASSIVNRTLPRILRLTHGSRVALIGPATPMTPRLHSYGVEILGGLRVRDPDGLADAVAAGGSARDFGQFGDYVHIRSTAAATRPVSFRGTGCLPRGDRQAFADRTRATLSLVSVTPRVPRRRCR